jgi:hypothetical protein
MGNTSATGGVLLPAQAAPDDEDFLNSIFQGLIAAITGLPGSLVRVSWQIDPPQEPPVGTNWCGFGVSVEDGDCPAIEWDPETQIYTYTIHDEITVHVMFYGPASRQYALQLRDGLRVPQNTEGLLTNAMRFRTSDRIRAVPEKVNQQWRRRHDISLRFRQEVVREYPVLGFLSAAVTVNTGTGVDDEITAPAGTPVIP